MQVPTPEQVDFAKVVMPLYIDTAKTFCQLGIGALALSIAFKEKVLGEAGRKGVTALLAISWSLFLLSVGASALYQYLAAKFVLYLLTDTWNLPWGNVFAPGVWYAVMLVSFFGGASLLVAGSARQLFNHKAASRTATATRG